MKMLDATINIIVCPKSLISTWKEHIITHYSQYDLVVYKNQDLSNITIPTVIIVTYDLIWRRPQFEKLKDFTLLLDEAQAIKNSQSKRSKFINKFKFKNLIMLSGTVCAGQFEHLHPFAKLLGWSISKEAFWVNFVNFRIHNAGGIPIKIVVGYKRVEELKCQMRQYGAIFMRSEDVITLPDKIETVVRVQSTKEYKTFSKDSVVDVEGIQLVGDTSLTKLLYERQLASLYNPNKWSALSDLIESTSDRLIIFYNWVAEFERLKALCKTLKRNVSYVNGSGKDLTHYEKDDSSILLGQYQSAATGLNLQKANKIIYFSLPLSADLYIQSMARTRRIRQERTCFYYYLLTNDSIEHDIFQTLLMRKDYNLKLFER